MTMFVNKLVYIQPSNYSKNFLGAYPTQTLCSGGTKMNPNKYYPQENYS